MRTGTLERYGRIWVPADAGAAKGYLARTLFVPHGRKERLGLMVSHIRPDEIAAVRLTDEGVPIDGRFAPVEIALSTIAPKNEAPRWVFVEDYEGGRGRAIVFLFAGANGAEPFAVVKVRTRGDGASLRRERDALERIGTSSLRGTIPIVRGYREDGEREVLTLTSVRGASMYREMATSLRPAALARLHFERAGAWLERFQAAAMGSHGDYWARNILVDGESVSAVDWESFDDSSDQLDDVFHFPLTYALAFRWGSALPPAERVRRAFGERNALSIAIAAWMRRFSEARGVSLDGLRRGFAEHLERGSEGALERPLLEKTEWDAMAGEIRGGTPCAFSG